MRIVAGLALLATLVAGTTTAQADTLDYVALGDSAAAGPLIPNQDPALWCLRSDRNYPQVTATLLGAKLTDVTCSGAVTDDLTGRRVGVLAPQFDALKPSTDLVTVTIGANDVGLFQIALSCINFLPEPAGISCEDRYTAGGTDQLSATAKAEATKRGATYVDFAAVTVGHDICAAPADRYLEGLIPTTIAAPLHPNAAGMKAFAAAVVQAAK